MTPIITQLRRHFQRVVVIGLNRLDAFYQHLDTRDDAGFVECFHAIDARNIKPPLYWKNIPALWACGESHRQVVARALSDGLQSVFIMEDDCRFLEMAEHNIASFMREIPDDWDGIMLGGQVSLLDGKTIPVTPRCSKCVQVERLHAYGLNRSGMQKFHDILCEPTSTPNDYRWGDAQEDGRLNVYRIEPFVAYQCDGRSSISGNVEPVRTWDHRVSSPIRDVEDVAVINLKCPFPVLHKLRAEGLVYNGGESSPFFADDLVKKVEASELRVAENLLVVAQELPERFTAAVENMRRCATHHRDAVVALWHPGEQVDFEHPLVEAANFEEAEAKIRSLTCVPS